MKKCEISQITYNFTDCNVTTAAFARPTTEYTNAAISANALCAVNWARGTAAREGHDRAPHSSLHTIIRNYSLAEEATAGDDGNHEFEAAIHPGLARARVARARSAEKISAFQRSERFDTM